MIEGKGTCKQERKQTMNQQYAYEGCEDAYQGLGYGVTPWPAPYQYPYLPQQSYPMMKNTGNNDFNKGLVSGVGIAAGIAALIWALAKKGG